MNPNCHRHKCRAKHPTIKRKKTTFWKEKGAWQLNAEQHADAPFNPFSGSDQNRIQLQLQFIVGSGAGW